VLCIFCSGIDFVGLQSLFAVKNNNTNSDLSDSQWIQASLPVRDGGLGVRRVSQLASPAFIASAASTLSIQDDILNDCIKSDSEFFQSYLSASSAKFGVVQDTLPTKQPF